MLNHKFGKAVIWGIAAMRRSARTMAFLLSASIALAASLLAAAPIAEHSCEVLHFLARPPLEFSGPADGFNDGTMSAWLVCNGPGTDCSTFPDDVLEPAFTGKELDEESGLYYFEARYLDPRVGRFTSPDEGPFKLQDPQSFNRYAYAQNSPFKYRDPDGRVIDTILDIGFIAYDVFDIARSLVRGEGVRGTQLAALGADIGGAFAPFATGGGAAVRAAAHARAAESAASAAGAVAARGVVRLDDLSKAAGALDRNGLTKAGRALQKHASRPGSAFSTSATRAGDLNAAGQAVVDDILTAPGSVQGGNRLGGVDILAPDGRGIRFNPDGSFRGFLEPPR